MTGCEGCGTPRCSCARRWRQGSDPDPRTIDLVAAARRTRGSSIILANHDAIYYARSLRPASPSPACPRRPPRPRRRRPPPRRFLLASCTLALHTPLCSLNTPTSSTPVSCLRATPLPRPAVLRSSLSTVTRRSVVASQLMQTSTASTKLPHPMTMQSSSPSCPAVVARRLAIPSSRWTSPRATRCAP